MPETVPCCLEFFPRHATGQSDNQVSPRHTACPAAKTHPFVSGGKSEPAQSELFAWPFPPPDNRPRSREPMV